MNAVSLACGAYVVTNYLCSTGQKGIVTTGSKRDTLLMVWLQHAVRA